MTTTHQDEIDQLTIRLRLRLTGDAHYWDLRRTYGDHSQEVLRHLRRVAAAEADDRLYTGCHH